MHFPTIPIILLQYKIGGFIAFSNGIINALYVETPLIVILLAACPSMASYSECNELYIMDTKSTCCYAYTVFTVSFSLDISTTTVKYEYNCRRLSLCLIRKIQIICKYSGLEIPALKLPPQWLFLYTWNMRPGARMN